MNLKININFRKIFSLFNKWYWI